MIPCLLARVAGYGRRVCLVRSPAAGSSPYGARARPPCFPLRAVIPKACARPAAAPFCRVAFARGGGGLLVRAIQYFWGTFDKRRPHRIPCPTSLT